LAIVFAVLFAPGNQRPTKVCSRGVFRYPSCARLNGPLDCIQGQSEDEIKLNEADFILLSSAFLAEIESKYL
jgi:hypothetical protein